MHIIELGVVQSLGQGGSVGKIVSTVIRSGSVDFLPYHTGFYESNHRLAET